MIDILYGEQSDLLAKPVLSQFKHLKLEYFKTGDNLFKNIVKFKPYCILIGDSLDGQIEKWILYLKKKIPDLPLFFIGENDNMRLLPLDGIFSRFNPNECMRIDISKAVFTTKKNGTKFSWNFLTEKDSFIIARNFLLNKLHTGYIKGELEQIPITNQSPKEITYKLLEKVVSLTGSDFAAISFSEFNYKIKKVYIRELYSAEIRSSILEICSKSFDTDKNDLIISMPPIPVIPVKQPKDINIRFICDLKNDNNIVSGILVIGSCYGYTRKLEVDVKNIIQQSCSRVLTNTLQYHVKKEETNTIHRAFTRFLPAAVIDDLLLKDSERELMTGEKRSIAVIFSHIRNFETIVEENEPKEIVEFLNFHFSTIGKIIKRHGGMIDKFIGDAIFAVFGAPISFTDNAQRAAKTAKEMIETCNQYQLRNIKIPEEGFSIGVGINRGEAIIGNIGCSMKFDYTSIGDTVNLAARLESLSKHYCKDILISESVNNVLDDSFITRLVDIAAVKGKNEASLIYSLEVDTESYTKEWLSLYQKGISMYKIGNWILALKYLRLALEKHTTDYPTLQLINRCEEYKKSPPEKWDGSIVLDFK